MVLKQEGKMKIYIAGKISGDKNYKKKFKKAERALKKKGHSVMNPAWLVEYKAFSWIDYMIVSEAMQRRCEQCYFFQIGNRAMAQESNITAPKQQDKRLFIL